MTRECEERDIMMVEVARGTTKLDIKSSPGGAGGRPPPGRQTYYNRFTPLPAKRKDRYRFTLTAH